MGANSQANDGGKYRRGATQDDLDKFDVENSIIYSINYVIIGLINLAM